MARVCRMHRLRITRDIGAAQWAPRRTTLKNPTWNSDSPSEYTFQWFYSLSWNLMRFSKGVWLILEVDCWKKYHVTKCTNDIYWRLIWIFCSLYSSPSRIIQIERKVLIRKSWLWIFQPESNIQGVCTDSINHARILYSLSKLQFNQRLELYAKIAQTSLCSLQLTFFFQSSKINSPSMCN